MLHVEKNSLGFRVGFSKFFGSPHIPDITIVEPQFYISVENCI